MSLTPQNLEMYQGETTIIRVTVLDEAGDPKSLTGASIKWVLQGLSPWGDPLLTKTTGDGIAITDGPGGKFEIRLDPVDTLALAGVYRHEARVADAGDNVDTVMVGGLTILESIAKT